MAARIVTGVGFFGAGMIPRSGDRTYGLTTAATVWADVGVGEAAGLGMYVMGILGAVFVFAILGMHNLRGLRRRQATDCERDQEARDDEPNAN